MRAPHVAGAIAPERRLGARRLPPLPGPPGASVVRPEIRTDFTRTGAKSAPVTSCVAPALMICASPAFSDPGKKDVAYPGRGVEASNPPVITPTNAATR